MILLLLSLQSNSISSIIAWITTTTTTLTLPRAVANWFRYSAADNNCVLFSLMSRRRRKESDDFKLTFVLSLAAFYSLSLLPTAIKCIFTINKPRRRNAQPARMRRMLWTWKKDTQREWMRGWNRVVRSPRLTALSLSRILCPRRWVASASEWEIKMHSVGRRPPIQLQ